jgi:hypothetical protein
VCVQTPGWQEREIWRGRERKPGRVGGGDFALDSPSHGCFHGFHIQHESLLSLSLQGCVPEWDRHRTPSLGLKASETMSFLQLILLADIWGQSLGAQRAQVNEVKKLSARFWAYSAGPFSLPWGEQSL